MYVCASVQSSPGTTFGGFRDGFKDGAYWELLSLPPPVSSFYPFSFLMISPLSVATSRRHHDGGGASDGAASATVFRFFTVSLFLRRLFSFNFNFVLVFPPVVRSFAGLIVSGREKGQRQREEERQYR